jgi:hypothetical protein
LAPDVIRRNSDDATALCAAAADAWKSVPQTSEALAVAARVEMSRVVVRLASILGITRTLPK